MNSVAKAAVADGAAADLWQAPRVVCFEEPAELPAQGSEWDALLNASADRSVFMCYRWLSAWRKSLGREQSLLLPHIYQEDSLVAAAAFKISNGVVGFAVDDRADYTGVLLRRETTPQQRTAYVELLLDHVRQQVGNFRCFDFHKVPTHGCLYTALTDSRYHATVTSTLNAPQMDMSTVAAALKKKSLRRHENGLKKRGEVSFETYSGAAQITGRLEGFFQQHIERWQGSDTPSLFIDPGNRDFYHALVDAFDGTGVLRFSELKLDGALVAAHLGFYDGVTFTWYKPSYDINLAKASPGEVLIKNLLTEARSLEADVFDFTIGDEAFKYRFATLTPQVADIHITPYKLAAAVKRTKLQVRDTLRWVQQRISRARGRKS